MGIKILRISIIIFLVLNSLLDSYFSTTAWDLLKNGLLICGFFITVAVFSRFYNKNGYSFNEISIFLISLFTLVYVYTQSLIHLPPSDIPNQKIFLRLFFYITICVFFYLFIKQKIKLIIWTTIISASILPNVWGFLLSGSGYGILMLYILSTIDLDKFNLYPSSVVYILFLFLYLVVSYFHEFQSYFFYGYFLYFTIFLLFIKINSESKNLTRIIIQLYFYYLLLSSTIFIFFYFYQGGLSNGNKSLGSFQVNSVGGSLLLFFPILVFLLNPLKIGWGSIKNIKTKYIIYIMSFPFIIYLLYISHTRSSIIAVSVFCLYCLYLILKRIRFRMWLLFCLGIMLIIFIPFAINYFLVSKSILSVLIRMEIWKTYLDVTFFEYPFWGLGFNGHNILQLIPNIMKYIQIHPLVIQEIINSNGATPHSHNLFVQILLEQGFVVLLFWLAFLYFLFTESILKKGKDKTIPIFLKIVLLSFIVHQSFDYTLQDPNTLLGFALVIGLLQRYSPPKFRVDREIHKWIIIAFIMISMIPIWILNVNHKQSLLLQDNLRIDNFQNLKELQPIPVETMSKSIFLDDLTAGIYLDDRMAFYSGYVYNKYLVNNHLNIDSKKEIVKDRISQCRGLNPYNPLCANFFAND